MYAVPFARLTVTLASGGEALSMTLEKMDLLDLALCR